MSLATEPPDSKTGHHFPPSLLLTSVSRPSLTAPVHIISSLRSLGVPTGSPIYLVVPDTYSYWNFHPVTLHFHLCIPHMQISSTVANAKIQPWVKNRPIPAPKEIGLNKVSNQQKITHKNRKLNWRKCSKGQNISQGNIQRKWLWGEGVIQELGEGKSQDQAVLGRENMGSGPTVGRKIV